MQNTPCHYRIRLPSRDYRRITSFIMRQLPWVVIAFLAVVCLRLDNAVADNAQQVTAMNACLQKYSLEMPTPVSHRVRGAK